MVKAVLAKKRRGGSDKDRPEGGDLPEGSSPRKARSHGVSKRLGNGHWEPRVQSLNVRAEEFGHERRDRRSLGRKWGVIVSRENHRDLPGVQGGEGARVC